MPSIIQRFGKHRSCRLQGEFVMVGQFWKPYTGQAVDGELVVMVLIYGAEKLNCIELKPSNGLREFYIILYMWKSVGLLKEGFSSSVGLCF